MVFKRCKKFEIYNEEKESRNAGCLIYFKFGIARNILLIHI